MANPTKGSRYTFTGDTIGNDAGRIVTNTVVTVREVVPAATTGAHDDSEDAVVVEWQEPALGVNDQGEPAIIESPRAWSVGTNVFSDLFKKVKD